MQCQETRTLKDVEDVPESDAYEGHENFSKQMKETRNFLVKGLYPRLARQDGADIMSRIQLKENVEIPKITYSDYCTVLKRVRYETNRFNILSETEQREYMYFVQPDVKNPLRIVKRSGELLMDEEEASTDRSVAKKIIRMLIRTAIEEIKMTDDHAVELPINDECENVASVACIIKSTWWDSSKYAFTERLRKKNTERDVARSCFHDWILYIAKENSAKWRRVIQAENEIGRVSRMCVETMKLAEESRGYRERMKEKCAGMEAKRQKFDKNASAYAFVRAPIVLTRNSSLETWEDSDDSDNDNRTQNCLERVSFALKSHKEEY